MMSFPSAAGRRVVRSRFGVLLRTYREGRSLTQGQLASTTGYSMALISRLESGQRNPSREVVERLAAALSLSNAETQQLLRTAGLSADGSLDDITHLTDAILTADPRDMIIRGLVQSDLALQASAWSELTAASLKMREDDMRVAVPIFRSLLHRRELSLLLRIYAARKLCEAYCRIGDLKLSRSALARGERLLDRLSARERGVKLRPALNDGPEREGWPLGFLRGSYEALHGEIEEHAGEFETARLHYQSSHVRYITLRDNLPEGEHRDAAQLGVVRSLNRLAKITTILGENEDAITLCERAKDELRSVPPSWQHEEASRRRKEAEASALARTADFARAIELHLAALHEAQEGGSPSGMLRNLLFLGDDYRRRVEARLDPLRRDDHSGHLVRSDAQVLRALLEPAAGGILSDRDLAAWLKEAEDYYRQAASVYQHSKTSLNYGHLLMGKAITARYRGRFDEAETLLLQALEAELSSGQNTQLTSIYTALGDVAWDRGVLPQAVYWYTRVRKVLQDDENGRYRAQHNHLHRIDESLRAVQLEASPDPKAEFHADLARDWHRVRGRLYRLVYDTISSTHARPITEDAADPAWIAMTADFEDLPGGRILAQNALSNSALEWRAYDVTEASQAQHQRRRERFLANVRAATGDARYRDLCSRHEVQNASWNDDVRHSLITARDLLRRFPDGYALETADFHVLPLAFMVKQSCALIQIPGPAATRALLEPSSAAEMHRRFERTDRHELATLAHWQYSYRFDDEKLADQLREIFSALERIVQADASNAAHAETTEEWITRILELRAAPAMSTL